MPMGSARPVAGSSIAKNRLCIPWDGKIKPLCLTVFAQPEGSYKLIKREKRITTNTGVEDGSTRVLFGLRPEAMLG